MRQLHTLPAAILLSTYALIASTTTTIATYPPGTILENLAIASGGDLFVSSISDGTVRQISPAGSSHLFGQVPGPLLGLAFNSDGTLIGAGGTSVYQFAPNGTSSLVANIAGAQDLNGLALLSPGNVLVADDIAPTIWQVNLSTGVSRAWLTSDLLAAPADGLPVGANGVKVFGGAVYISNTGAGTILRAPILADGSAGTPTIYATNLSADDFAFGADGSIFAAGQAGTIVRLRPDGTRTNIPTGTLGDAAVAFGRTAADLNDIYVVNNGGAFLDLPDGPEAASVIRIATDTTGAMPVQQAVPEPSTLWLTGTGAGVALAVILVRRRRRIVIEGNWSGLPRSHSCSHLASR